MKRFLSVCLPLLLIAMMVLTSCQVQKVDPSDIPGVTQPPSEQEQQLKILTDALDSSEPFSADSTVTLTISEELKLVSTFKVNKEGSCNYTRQYLKQYVMGASGNDLIGTEKGTKKASDSPEDGVSVSILNFDLAYFTDYTMVGVSGLSFTGELSDEHIADFLGFDLDASNMTVSIEINDDYYVDSITLTYETVHGDVEVATVYKY